MKQLLLILTCTIAMSAFVPTSSLAAEVHTRDGGPSASLPSLSYVLFRGYVQPPGLPAFDDDEYYDINPVTPARKVKQLRTAGTVLFALAGFPFLPAGLALAGSYESEDANAIGRGVLALSSSLIVYGILMFIHADILERRHGPAETAALLPPASCQRW